VDKQLRRSAKRRDLITKVIKGERNREVETAQMSDGRLQIIPILS
jgi:hypothetical protein